LIYLFQYDSCGK